MVAKQSGMRRSGTGAGGGAGMNKNVTPGVKYGPKRTNVISPGGVSQMGTAIGGKMRGEGRHTSQSAAVNIEQRKAPLPVQHGNQVALNVGKGGPGTGRTIYASGSQATQGPVAPGNPPAKNKDILGAFGKDYQPRGRFG